MTDTATRHNPWPPRGSGQRAWGGEVSLPRWRALLGALTLSLWSAGACGTSASQISSADAGEAPAAQRRVVLGPRVSRSRGQEGGVVLLWPRIIPSAQAATLRSQAAALQARLRGLISEAFPGRAVDTRPEPERVCPREGCLGASVGVLILAEGGGCAAVVQVSAPGRSPAEQMIWAGVMSSALEVPFRQPPESFAKIRDFVPCAQLVSASKEREGRVLEALRGLRR